MPTDKHQWDFFIAHAGPDVSTAEALYDFLSGSAKVFLDSRSLEIASDWDLELSKAQRQSFITVASLVRSAGSRRNGGGTGLPTTWIC